MKMSAILIKSTFRNRLVQSLTLDLKREDIWTISSRFLSTSANQFFMQRIRQRKVVLSLIRTNLLFAQNSKTSTCCYWEGHWRVLNTAVLQKKLANTRILQKIKCQMPQHFHEEPYGEEPYLGGGRNFSSFFRYLATVSATPFFRAYNS